MLTCRYQQLAELIEVIEKIGKDTNIKVFFMDCWSIGAEGVTYLRDLEGYRIKIEGFFHAGCWDSDDRLYKAGISYWGEHFEKMILSCFDKIYVGSDYSKDLISSVYPSITGTLPKEEYIKVSPIPVITKAEMEEEVSKNEQSKSSSGILHKAKGKKIIFFPHRLSDEKGVAEWKTFKRIAEKTGLYYPVDASDFDTPLTKVQYYSLLLNTYAVVSFSKQETFGICIWEAVYAGAYVCLPEKLSYTSEGLRKLSGFGKDGEKLPVIYYSEKALVLEDSRCKKSSLVDLANDVLHRLTSLTNFAARDSKDTLEEINSLKPLQHNTTSTRFSWLFERG